MIEKPIRTLKLMGLLHTNPIRTLSSSHTPPLTTAYHHTFGRRDGKEDKRQEDRVMVAAWRLQLRTNRRRARTPDPRSSGSNSRRRTRLSANREGGADLIGRRGLEAATAHRRGPLRRRVHEADGGGIAPDVLRPAVWRCSPLRAITTSKSKHVLTRNLPRSSFEIRIFCEFCRFKINTS